MCICLHFIYSKISTQQFSLLSCFLGTFGASKLDKIFQQLVKAA
uniref:Uncharacterized protein n=1 Tax=Anguilla anguilla TaxID=7936 RepID=A0A0E9S757_ANGAN